jgi:cysteine desulfurase / selenocysteine lyase
VHLGYGSPVALGALRDAFPAFRRRVHGRPLVYLDTASTAQKPDVVLAAMQRAYEATSNVHRGVHALSVEATERMEAARRSVAGLLHATDPREIVFVRGTTEAINLVAQTWGRANVGEGDAIVVTALEHHSNLVPWQMLCREKRAHLRVLPIDARGDVVLDRLERLLGPETRLVALSHVSNSLGTVLPVREIVQRAKACGATILVDGAQAVAHGPVDVVDLGCDFYAFSGHKLYGPTGIGALWGRRALLEAMPPWQGGGEMVLSVDLESATWNEVPYKFEAGTPDIVGAIGLGAAIDWFLSLDAEVFERERSLLAYAASRIGAVDGVRLIGKPARRSSVVSFVLGSVHPHDVGTALDLEGIAVRTGHHCTQPVMAHFGVDATIRASLGVYSTREDVDALADALDRVRRLFEGR